MLWASCLASLERMHAFVMNGEERRKSSRLKQFLLKWDVYVFCLSNALHSSIGQNIKLLACPVSDLRCLVRAWKTSNGHNSAMHHPIPFVFGCRVGFLGGRRIERRHFCLDQIQDGGRRPFWKTSNGHRSATRHPIDFVFGSRLVFFSKDRLDLFNLTAHKLPELYYDRPTS